MKKEIYNLFTVENKIILSKEMIETLASKLKDTYDLKTIFNLYVENFSTNSISDNEFLEFLSNFKRKENYFEIKNISLSKNDMFIEKYTFLKNKIQNIKIDGISNLKNSHSYIFGIFYKNEDGDDVIEDDTKIIKIKFVNPENIFLIEDIFICCYGKKESGVFMAENVILPEIDKPNNLCNLKRKDIMILFFGGLIDELNLKRILYGFDVQPEMVVFSGPFEKNFEDYVDWVSNSFKNIEFVFLPAKNDFYDGFLPKSVVLDSDRKFNKNVHFVTNPCEINLYNRRIVLLKDNYLTDLKRNGNFYGNNYLDLITRTILSQYSYNLRALNDCFYKSSPDLFVVFEDYYSLSCSVNGVSFVVNGSFLKEKNSFVVYDSSNNIAELSNLS